MNLTKSINAGAEVVRLTNDAGVNVAWITFGPHGYFKTLPNASLCIEHLKTIMIAVKEGADIEVVVKPKGVAGEPTSFTPNLGHPYGNIPTPAAEFDEKLHDTIMKLMARSGNLYEADTIIETARQICDACKITPGK